MAVLRLVKHAGVEQRSDVAVHSFYVAFSTACGVDVLAILDT